METLKQQDLITEMVAELKPIVESIEKRLATTQYHYGDYMSILGRYPAELRKTMAALLLKSGANVDGVKWAYKLMS